MIETDNYKFELAQYETPLQEVRDSFDIPIKQDKVAELEADMEAPDFWNDVEHSNEVMKTVKGLKDILEAYKRVEEEYDEVGTLIEMADEEEDTSLLVEIEETLNQFKEDFEALRIQTLLSGEFDKDNAIVTLHAGAGGTESCDWTGMLMRMYTRWAEKRGFSTEILDYLEGEEAGVKSVTIQINGENAYGYLKSEKGVHRLVRISPFNAAGKRQTSFSSCDVMPDIEEDVSVDIKDEDLRIDTYRASGAGGQHINKTSSAIRITHLPTGIVVQCQNQRSQHQNKDKAMKMLASKLYVLKQQENQEKLDDIRGDISENGFGSQIRSYVMQPYTMVKDHRTGMEVSNVNGVLDGNVEPFMNAYLKWINLNKE
ncbi:MAG: peptide chain release factor 2 [Lachnospiraceae bacterium]|nr:peptide chain release factor 2 [Lachnospiraceae bacterium]